MGPARRGRAAGEATCRQKPPEGVCAPAQPGTVLRRFSVERFLRVFPEDPGDQGGQRRACEAEVACRRSGAGSLLPLQLYGAGQSVCPLQL